MIERTPNPTRNAERSAVVIGAGGNIGSQLVAHLSAMGLARATLIDRDTYEEKNHFSQAIFPKDVGQSKAKIQARRLRAMAPSLRVDAIHAAVEDIPLGRLRASVIVACLDSRVARQYASAAAWHLGVPMVDTGVDATGLLARVNVYVPHSGAPCMECAWDDSDYAALEQRYACQDQPASPAPTNAPRALGALAAALAAIEAQKILEGDWDHSLAGRMVLVDLRHHKHTVTSLRCNANCRFDHRTWTVEPLATSPGKLTLGRLRSMDDGDPNGGGSSLSVAGRSFARTLVCAGCQTAVPHLHLFGSVRRAPCPACGDAMTARMFETLDWLDLSLLERRDNEKRLSSLGFRAGDIVALDRTGRQRYFELGGHVS